jgi:hypothetical protein
MSKFNKLSRAEMKMVMGGTEPVCQVDAICAVFIEHVGDLYGKCQSGSSGCTCSTVYNGVTYYGNAWTCKIS